MPTTTKRCLSVFNRSFVRLFPFYLQSPAQIQKKTSASEPSFGVVDSGVDVDVWFQKLHHLSLMYFGFYAVLVV